MKVSVILTSYNKPDYIERVLQSMMEQTYQNWELFIMDDGSEPETLVKILPFLADERIQLFTHTVQPAKRLVTVRYATLMNDALNRVTGELISYLTDDTIYSKDRLEKMVGFFQTTPHANIVYSAQRVIYIDEQRNERLTFVRAAEYKLEHAAFQVDHCSVMHRSSLLPLVYQMYGQYWNDQPKHWHHADAVFWMRLNQFAAFYPIKEQLDTTYKTPNSFHHTFSHMPYELIDGTIISQEDGKCYQIYNDQLHPINEKSVNSWHSRAVAVPKLCLLKYEVQEALDVPNYTVVTANGGKTLYYIEGQKKRKFDSKRDFHYFRFHQKEVYFITESELNTFDDAENIQAFGRFNPPNRRLFKHKQLLFLLMNHTFCPIAPEIIKLFGIHHQPMILKPSQLSVFSQGKSIVPLYMESLQELNIDFYSITGRKHPK
ncbi:glycosyltransferase family 2 protein [Bacillus sp. NPDC077027]|uniref:glycosyltransferase family 2 protein n=1 Tax=Bacillus sp. NPDC077027 TaxID=3390548 RepID=UPI003D0449C3